MGVAGYEGDGSAGYKALLDSPHGIGVDSLGVLYIADTGNHVVRRVGADGNIETFAGTSAAGYSGDGASALSAELDSPEGVAVGEEGTIFIADTGNRAVRFVDSEGKAGTLMGGPAATEESGFKPAKDVALSGPKAVWVVAENDKAVLVADASAHKLERVQPPWPGYEYKGNVELPSDDGLLTYVFDYLGSCPRI